MYVTYIYEESWGERETAKFDDLIDEYNQNMEGLRYLIFRYPWTNFEKQKKAEKIYKEMFVED